MGCGKSTVGKKLSQSLDLPYVDLDEYIENQQGKSISEIFQDDGEIVFRKHEYQAVKEMVQSSTPAVISLGGGTPCYFDTMEKIVTSPHASVYLHTSIPALAKRLFPEKAQRPLISHVSTLEALTEFIGKHLFERSPFYQKAQIKVTTDSLSPSAIAEEIQAALA